MVRKHSTYNILKLDKEQLFKYAIQNSKSDREESLAF